MHERKKQKTDTLISKITKHFDASKEQTWERYCASDIQDAILRYTLCAITVGIPTVFSSFGKIYSPTKARINAVKKAYIVGYGRVMKESVDKHILIHLFV